LLILVGVHVATAFLHLLYYRDRVNAAHAPSDMIYSGEALGAGCNLLMLHCTDVLQQSDARGQQQTSPAKNLMRVKCHEPTFSLSPTKRGKIVAL